MSEVLALCLKIWTTHVSKFYTDSGTGMDSDGSALNGATPSCGPWAHDVTQCSPRAVPGITQTVRSRSGREKAFGQGAGDLGSLRSSRLVGFCDF